MSIDPQLVVPDPTKRTDAGAIAPWMGTSSQIAAQSLEAVCRHYGTDSRLPWRALPEDAKHAILYGTGRTPIRLVLEDGTRHYETNKPFEGVIPNLERRFRNNFV